MRRWWAAMGLGMMLASWPSSGRARTQEPLRYRFETIWNAAVRLIRVDMGLAIDERDPDAGFFLFNYVDHDKPYRGSFELVRTGDGARDAVTVVVQVGGMPRYVERMILSKLEKKLSQEYGEPAPPPKPPKPEPPEEKPPTEPPATEGKPGGPERG